MNLKRLIEDLDYTNISGDIDKEVLGIEYNSKNIKENFLFIAIKGFKLDAHEFIYDALNNGAKVFIVEDDINLEKKDDITIIKVKDSRRALAILSDAFYSHPSKQLNMIGITGTNGKTSTSYFINSILQKEKNKTGIIGTLGIKINDILYETDKTTPESRDIQKYLYKMTKEGIDHCIMEVSSHSLVLSRVDSVDFDIGIFTNLSEEHLDFHKTLEEYMKAKLKLFYMTNKYNIINLDDKFGKRIVKILNEVNTKTITYGINSGDIRAKNIIQSQTYTKFDLVTPIGKVNLTLNTPGIFNVYNALAASSCALSLGINLETIKKGLEDIKNIKGRFEVIPSDEKFNIIIDFAHSPDGFENVLETVNEFKLSRIITVFGCGGDRDKTKRPKMGGIAAKYSDICIITSDNSRSEKTENIIKEIINGIDENSCKYFKIPDRKKAIKKAIEIAKPNDIIMILGKGHETYQIINGKKEEFDEFKIIKEILKYSRKNQ